MLHCLTSELQTDAFVTSLFVNKNIKWGYAFLNENKRKNLVPKLLILSESFCFASMLHPVSVGGVIFMTKI